MQNVRAVIITNIQTPYNINNNYTKGDLPI